MHPEKPYQHHPALVQLRSSYPLGNVLLIGLSLLMVGSLLLMLIPSHPAPVTYFPAINTDVSQAPGSSEIAPGKRVRLFLEKVISLPGQHIVLIEVGLENLTVTHVEVEFFHPKFGLGHPRQALIAKFENAFYTGQAAMVYEETPSSPTRVQHWEGILHLTTPSQHFAIPFQFTL